MFRPRTLMILVSILFTLTVTHHADAAQPKKIVFLCSASKSMGGSFQSIKQQLKESVNAMTAADEQEFNVVFFKDDKVIQLFKDRLRIASSDNKKKAADFIDAMTASGEAKPLAAIKAVIAQKPAAIYFLSDGIAAMVKPEEVVRAFAKADPAPDSGIITQDNKPGVTPVHCIVLLGEDSASSKAWIQALKKIAYDSVGSVKMIKKSDLQ